MNREKERQLLHLGLQSLWDFVRDRPDFGEEIEHTLLQAKTALEEAIQQELTGTDTERFEAMGQAARILLVEFGQAALHQKQLKEFPDGPPKRSRPS